MEEMERKNAGGTKISYEQLEMAANQFSEQIRLLTEENRKLKEQMSMLNVNNLFTELSFKFRVVELSDKFSEDFVKSIISQIEDTMTPKMPDDVSSQNEETDGQGENK